MLKEIIKNKDKKIRLDLKTFKIYILEEFEVEPFKSKEEYIEIRITKGKKI